MKIYAVTEYDKPFVYLSTGYAFENLGNIFQCEYNVCDIQTWKQRKIEKDSKNDVLVLFENAVMEICGLTVKELRKYYPNAKLICLGSDTMYFIITGKNNGFQFNYPQEVDLFLDTMPDAIEKYKQYNINIDSWMWTISNKLIQYIKKFNQKDFENREYDFIGVYSPHTIERQNSYRNKMINYIKNNNHSFTQGGGTGHTDPDIDKIFNTYCNSKFTLGTTSHDNPNLQGMKGFRDWIGPFMGALLIYDNYKTIINIYNGGSLVPIYEYENFKSIIDVAHYFSTNKVHREELLKQQQKWAIDNTIDNQLVQKLLQNKIIHMDYQK